MVVRVYGSANGVDIVFTPIGNDCWECAVPKFPSGEYVVDLYAEDEAGNVGYAATMLFVVNAKHIVTKIEWLKIAANSNVALFQAFGKTDATKAIETTKAYTHQVHMQNFKMEVTRCEKCGGDMFELLDS